MLCTRRGSETQRKTAAYPSFEGEGDAGREIELAVANPQLFAHMDPRIPVGLLRKELAHENELEIACRSRIDAKYPKGSTTLKHRKVLFKF